MVPNNNVNTPNMVENYMNVAKNVIKWIWQIRRMRNTPIFYPKRIYNEGPFMYRLMDKF